MHVQNKALKLQSSQLHSNKNLHDLYKEIPINTTIFNYFKKAVAISVNIKHGPRNIWCVSPDREEIYVVANITQKRWLEYRFTELYNTFWKKDDRIIVVKTF
jgi:hypothetical protein